MLDFTEQVHSTESPPALSADTQTASDNLPVIESPALASPEHTAATIAALAPYYSSDKLVNTVFVQDEDEDELETV